MSGIAAIIRFDGHPVDGDAIRRMTGAMAYRGRDGIRHDFRQTFALGHCAFHTTAEALEANMPLASAESGLVIVMDGYLANPDELRAELVTRNARLRNRSDAELVLHAFETWGERCVDHLEGEFAFLICDERQGTVFCAKDHAGMRPLHYHWDGRRLLVASDIAGVLAAGDFVPRLDADSMAEHLASEFYRIDATVWSGVMRLPFASTLIARQATGTGPVCSRYWQPPLEVRELYRKDEDYFAHYREMLMDCVRRASRSHAPVACEVSGGHDSSALFAMACRLQQRHELPAPDVQGFTMAGEPGSASDEVAFARDVGRFLGKSIHEATPFVPDRSWYEEQVARDRDMPYFPNSVSMANEVAAATAQGCRVLIDGEGGDEFVGGSAFYLNEMIRAGALGDLGAELRRLVARRGWRVTGKALFWSGIRPLGPPAFNGMMRRLRKPRAPWGEHLGIGPHWVSASVQDRLAQLREADWRDDRSWQVADPARRKMWRELLNPWFEQLRDCSSRLVAQLGMELRTPMYSRRYIEFAFALPERLRIRNGMTKYIHLRAMQADLPESVLERRSKAEFSFTFDRHLKAMANVFCEEIPAVAIGEVCGDGLRNLYANYSLTSGAVWELWRVYGCHLLRQQQTDSA